MTSFLSLDASGLSTAVDKMAQDLRLKISQPFDRWIFAGVQRRGVPLAHRLVRVLAGAEGLPVGTLDITFYRDDTGDRGVAPVVQETHFPYDLTGKTVVLVDDVLFTGRTVRCALDELMDFGRPDRVLLAVLADRGHRELPIQADVVGVTLATTAMERVDVRLSEVDGEDGVWITSMEKGREDPS